MKTKFSRRILAFVLVLALAVPMFVFNASAEDEKITFNLGANGSATHTDNNNKSATYNETVDGYNLSITNGNYMYPGSRDAKGNSCIKFGTGSSAGSCTINVPADVTSVVLHVARYKANSATVTVNGTAYTLTKNSNDGAYDQITVDTTSKKTISFSVTSGKRAMLNTIEFIVAGSNDTPSLTVLGNNLVTIGNTTTLEANLSNSDDEVVWTSSNDEIATVENGVVTGVAMGNVTITATAGELTATKELSVFPSNTNPISIADALTICAFTGATDSPLSYTVIGEIKSIDTAYDSSYGNITVTITDGTDSIKVFRLKGGSELKVGNTIKVTGVLCTYNSTPEFNAGATYVKLTTVNDIKSSMALAYTYEHEEGVYSNSNFAFKFTIDATVANIADVTAYGIKVSAGGKDVYYNAENAVSWTEENGKIYVIVELGDIINDTEKLSTVFTVTAYAEVGGEILTSKNSTSYSVASIVAYYLDNLGYDEVAHLYDFISNEHGLI